jgi:methionyl-tRNA formyltransferase
MNIIFFGSSAFSIPVLESLSRSPHQMRHVVTTPPKPSGRGRKLTRTVVHAWATDKGLNVLTPGDLTAAAFIRTVEEAGAPYFIVASYGKILPEKLLSLARPMALNVHPSLLPLYRGAAPIAWQLLHGEQNSGVSIARITIKLDAGEILGVRRIPIEAEDTAVTLETKMAELGAGLLLEVLDGIQHNSYVLKPQHESEATYAPKLKKEMGLIDWTKPASTVHNQIRALVPWPCAYTFYKGKRIRILAAALDPVGPEEYLPGTVLEVNAQGFARVQTGTGSLRILLMQAESSRVTNAHAFALGRDLSKGSVLE